MSFSKAKIQRFNEVHSCAPPPGAYNPSIQEPHQAGAVISKSERFQAASPANSVHSSENSSAVSGNGSIFRTPGVNKKKKAKVGSESKVPATQLFLNNDESETLKEKIVECMNKDESIKELVIQIEELKDQINHLEVQQNQLNVENQQCESNLKLNKVKYENFILQLKDKQELEMAELTKNVNEEIDAVKMESAKIKTEYTEELLEIKNNICLLEKYLSSYQGLMEENRCEFAKQLEENRFLEKSYNESLNALTELQRSHSEEIDELKKAHLLEVQDIEYEMLKCMTDAQKNLELKNNELLKLKEEIIYKEQTIKELREEIINIKNDFAARLLQAEENSVEKIKLAEIQMEEKCKDVEADLLIKLKNQQSESVAILKECQAIGEFNIIQSEMEKNEIKQELLEITNCLQELKLMKASTEEECEAANTNLLKVSKELVQTKNELKEQLSAQNEILEKSKSEKHTYQVSLNKTLQTVEALKNRLINSDRDVEQLKEELENMEIAKLQLEEKCNKLLDQLATVTRVNDKLLFKNEHIDEYVNENVNLVEKSLLEKVDKMHQVYKKQIEDLQSVVNEKEDQLQESMTQLTEQQQKNMESCQLINTVKVELEQMESENTELKYVKTRLESSVERLQQEITETCEINRKYIDQSGKFDALQQKFEEIQQKNVELEKVVAAQNCLINPFREQLEGYEAERLTLLSEKSEALNEVREISLRYAGLLGHQNNKQKVKHLIDLKQKNLDLCSANRGLETKYRSQCKLVEKLKKELSEKNCPKKPPKMNSLVPNSDKENVSPLKLRNLP